VSQGGKARTILRRGKKVRGLRNPGGGKGRAIERNRPFLSHYSLEAGGGQGGLEKHASPTLIAKDRERSTKECSSERKVVVHRGEKPKSKVSIPLTERGWAGKPQKVDPVAERSRGFKGGFGFQVSPGYRGKK